MFYYCLSGQSFENITKQAAEKTKLEIVPSVVEAYTNAVLVKENIKIVESNLKVSGDFLFCPLLTVLIISNVLLQKAVTSFSWDKVGVTRRMYGDKE